MAWCGAGAASGVLYLSDNGFFGVFWQTHWQQDYDAVVFTSKNYHGADARRLRKRHSSCKRIVETVNGQLEHTIWLHFPGARSKWGLTTRIAAKIAALNLSILLNSLFGRPKLALETLFNC